ncbi:MAG: GTP-binding protein, partial [Gemmatimonadota bacterium]
MDGVRLGIVDVPGHEDFIRNMLAGATGIDVLLLVVAADEGVMPQTREHAAIAQLLGVERAVVALTKADLVGDDWLGLVHDDVAGFLDGTPFASATVVPTSTVTGRGIDELRAALAAALGESDGAADDLFRMPVDRAFTVRGTGTVITGTVWSGTLTDDATVRLLPDGPECRVRGLQVHGAGVAALSPGERGAIALVGVDRDEAARGMTAVVDPSWEPTDRITARLQVLPGPQWTVEPHQRVRVHLGTAEVMARVVLLDRETLAPGQQGWVQLRLETPLLARGRDRFVIRSYSPVTTIGGGVVAEPIARRRARIDAETAA